MGAEPRLQWRVEGMDCAEVAEALGVSEPTARRSFSRAHKQVMTWAQHDPFLVDYLLVGRREATTELAYTGDRCE